MKLYYRISDQSYPKTKLIGATKQVCFENFCKVFAEVIQGDPSPTALVVCDNCGEETRDMVRRSGLPYTSTNKGNAGSLVFSLELALKECHDNDLVYFVEDDYLHLPIAPQLLEEGIKRSDYVTLYDHPDKYTRVYNGGEFSKVIRTPSSHWRYTASTCMTFGTKVKTLKEDLEIWQKYTSEKHPHDHHIFTELGKKGRRLAVCIPGVACHTDLTFSSAIDEMLIDSWAIEMMIKEVGHQLVEIPNIHNPLHPSFHEYLLLSKCLHKKQGREKLMALDALRMYFLKEKDGSVEPSLSHPEID